MPEGQLAVDDYSPQQSQAFQAREQGEDSLESVRINAAVAILGISTVSDGMKAAAEAYLKWQLTVPNVSGLGITLDRLVKP